MQQSNGQLLWAAWWFLVSKLILKWKSGNIWYLLLEEWMMWNRGMLVPFMKGPVPASSSCLTWAFTLPLLMSPLGFSAMFWREREEQYHIEEQCHMKEQNHITAVNLERPRFKICSTWSQTSSACGPALVTVSVYQKPLQDWAVLDPTPISGRAQHPAVWDGAEVGQEGRSLVLGQGAWWCWASQHSPAWQLVPVTKNKDNFGAVVGFPRNIIFAALTAPPDRREAVSKHSFFLGLREKCQIVETLWEFL